MWMNGGERVMQRAEHRTDRSPFPAGLNGRGATIIDTVNPECSFFISV